MDKTLHVTEPGQLRTCVDTFGNPELFKCLSKAWDVTEGWMKSTKAMQIHGVGCVVQVTTQQGENIAEAVTFVPGVKIAKDADGNYKLRKF